MTQRQLEKKLELWQKRLRLQDWTIAIYFQRLPDFESPGRIGESRVHPETKSARVWIMWPKDYAICRFTSPQDIDKTIVHELLHIHMSLIEKQQGAVEVEQVIEALSSALVEAYRCTDSPKKSKSARTSGR